MNRRFISIMIVTVILVTGAITFAQQQRPFNELMKEVQTTFGSLRKNIEGNNPAAVAQDAAKLETLFTEAEAFWAVFDTQDAMGFAKRGREAAAAVGAAAKANDLKAAQTSVPAIQKTCANCHYSHREETGKGFFIKP